MDIYENLICAVLRRERPNWTGDTESVRRFLEVARYHGVLPLLAMELQGSQYDGWPREIRAACRGATRDQTVYELARRAATRQAVDALASADASPVVLKGSGLAYTLYRNPILRTRGDTDLLIRPGRRPEAEQALAQLGYVKNRAAEGEFISYQALWTRSGAFGIAHHVDLHWRINNSQVLAKVLGYDELAVRAIPVPALGPSARTLCLVDALLFACIHRAGHVHAPYFIDGVPHKGIDRLIWLYDIHLIVSTSSAAELDEFATLATAKGIKAICFDGLARTRDLLGTPVPPRIVDALRAAGASERSARYLRDSKARLLVEDFRAFDCWSDRMGWVRELAFPPAHYMRGKYPTAAVKWLPVLYARRGLRGIARLLSPRDSSDAR